MDQKTESPAPSRRPEDGSGKSPNASLDMNHVCSQSQVPEIQSQTSDADTPALSMPTSLPNISPYQDHAQADRTEPSQAPHINPVRPRFSARTYPPPIPPPQHVIPPAPYYAYPPSYQSTPCLTPGAFQPFLYEPPRYYSPNLIPPQYASPQGHPPTHYSNATSVYPPTSRASVCSCPQMNTPGLSVAPSAVVPIDVKSLPPELPYLVLGFGCRGTNSMALKGYGSVLCNAPVAICRDNEVIIAPTPQDRVPWSGDPIQVYGYAHRAMISLPPFTEVVGASSGLNCFEEGSMSMMSLTSSCINLVEFPDQQVYSGVRGIIYPHKYPVNGLIVTRRLKTLSPDYPQEHLLSSGFALLPQCRVVKYGQDVPFPGRGEKMFLHLSEDYAVREFDAEENKLHDPPSMPKLPACLFNLENTLLKGIRVKSRGIPFLACLLCVLLLVCPGLVQAYGSQDEKWGDILNAVIGTGSVLVGVVLIIFQKIFGFDVTSNMALRGILIIRSNLGAALFARQVVRDIQKVACDPRIPQGLIARYKNSGVRADRTGWLKVGQSIRLEDMFRHGYHVLRDRGLVLDLVTAWYYPCTKTGNVVRMYRPGEEIVEKLCETIENGDVFEG